MDTTYKSLYGKASCEDFRRTMVHLLITMDTNGSAFVEFSL
jgi:hypothetical protein